MFGVWHFGDLGHYVTLPSLTNIKLNCRLELVINVICLQLSFQSYSLPTESSPNISSSEREAEMFDSKISRHMMNIRKNLESLSSGAIETTEKTREDIQKNINDAEVQAKKVVSCLKERAIAYYWSQYICKACAIALPSFVFVFCCEFLPELNLKCEQGVVAPIVRVGESNPIPMHYSIPFFSRAWHGLRLLWGYDWSRSE